MNYLRVYAQFLSRFIKVQHPLRVVADTSNGAVGLVLKEFRRFLPREIELLCIDDKPDGNFPAHGPDPTAPDAPRDLIRAVRKRKADVGVIFDPDGDRTIFVDDQGRPISADHTAILIASNFKGPVLLTPLSGYPIREYLAQKKRRAIECRVGHFFMKKVMRQRKIPLGVETSGHYFFKDFFYADSGIFAAIVAMNQISYFKSRGIKLGNWVSALPHYPRIPETNFHAADKKNIMRRVETHFRRLARRISKVDGLTMEFGSPGSSGEWWFNVRPSNTEDLLRLNIEARQKTVLDRGLLELTKIIRTD